MVSDGFMAPHPDVIDNDFRMGKLDIFPTTKNQT